MEEGKRKCCVCGRETDNLDWCRSRTVPRGPATSYSMCDECKRRISAEAMWKNLQVNDDVLACPWCGYEDWVPWEIGYGVDNAAECASCGRGFSYIAEAHRVFTSWRRPEEMPDGWNGGI